MTVRIPDKRQSDVEVPLEEAVALWLRVLRNAGHSFRAREGPNRAREEALLLSHDAEVPSELPDLAYLYLLRLIAEPALARDARSDGRLYLRNTPLMGE